MVITVVSILFIIIYFICSIASCGHFTPRSYEIEILGKKYKIRPFATKNAKPFCRKCFIKAIKYCTECGLPIFPGDTVFASIKAIEKNDDFICFRKTCGGKNSAYHSQYWDGTGVCAESIDFWTDISISTDKIPEDKFS